MGLLQWKVGAFEPMIKTILICSVLMLAGCAKKKPPVQPPIVIGTNAPAEWFAGLLISFKFLPDLDTQSALEDAGATRADDTSRIWRLTPYEWRNQYQQTALEMALKAGATVGPLR